MPTFTRDLTGLNFATATLLALHVYAMKYPKDPNEADEERNDQGEPEGKYCKDSISCQGKITVSQVDAHGKR